MQHPSPDRRRDDLHGALLRGPRAGGPGSQRLLHGELRVRGQRLPGQHRVGPGHPGDVCGSRHVGRTRYWGAAVLGMRFMRLIWVFQWHFCLSMHAIMLTFEIED